MYSAHLTVTLAQFENEVIFGIDFKIRQSNTNHSYISISDQFNDVRQCIHFVEDTIHTQKFYTLSKLHLEITTESEQEDIYYNNHKDCALFLKAELASRFLQYCKFITWFTLDINFLLKKQECNEDQVVKYDWKFAKKLELMKGLSPYEFKAITLNNFHYLQYVLVGYNNFNNQLMKLLSKANWPNLNQLNLMSPNCRTDSIKYMRKHSFFNVERFVFGVQKAVYQMAAKLTKIDSMKMLVLYDYDMQQQFSEWMRRDVLTKHIVKSRLLNKYLDEMLQTSQVRYMINNQLQYCYML